ncbi:hypothetical protein [Paenibacillus gansuensis]|uniref:Uncharacterized protein n=1 Tax=Paenibacillus gansuensis TaxID=306542 RepID=A0ABW5PMG1_9BACL
MNRVHSHLREVDMIGKLADLKTFQAHQSLLLHALIDLLNEKGIVTKEEIAARAEQLDGFTSG